MFKNICLIGAGNIGTRHLQALAKVKQALSIFVVDPSKESLKLAEKKYNEIEQVNPKTQIKFLSGLKQLPEFLDIAIIATTSDIRSKITENLLSITAVKFIIFEKLLFQKRTDYGKIQKLLVEKNCSAFVNCPMRLTPFYTNLKNKLNSRTIQYSLVGCGFEFVTGVIHYIDHMAYLAGSTDFEVDTNHLIKNVFESKRRGFLELKGTLNVYFKNGSVGSFTILPGEDSYFYQQIFSQNYRFIRNEFDNRSFYSKAEGGWKWKTKDEQTPYQSSLTNIAVEDILTSESCSLTPYAQSAVIHIKLLDPLLKFLNANSKSKYTTYPFT